MAGATLLTLIDDIATVLDDVATMTKVAARKTAGVLGDDLALNAQRLTGLQAARELPVVWAVAKGSFLNKAILVPSALLVSWQAPWMIRPLLMLGGAFLCFEGFETLLHKWQQHTAATGVEQVTEAAVPSESAAGPAFEKEKIRAAIRTDFILSAEIVVITLGTLVAASALERVSVLVGISLLMTVGVYGLVAGIVKLDDLGLHLQRGTSRMRSAIGSALLRAAPMLMKALAIVGTAAMFMVGGGILLHGWPGVGHAVEHAAKSIGGLPGGLLNILAGLTVGVLAGALAFAPVTLGKRFGGKLLQGIGRRENRNGL
jgi:uncharacterized protein